MSFRPRDDARMKSLCLTTSYTPDYGAMGEVCAASLRRYAETFGCDMHIEAPSGDTGNRPAAWRRVLLVPELFDRGYEFVLWLDADAMFVRFDSDVLGEACGGADICLSNLTVPFHPKPVPNTGVMLLRNSDWTRDFLRRVWDRTALIHHHWWENAAVIDLMGYRSMLDQSAADAPDEAVLSRMRILGDRWNHSPLVGRDPSPVIRHYGGMSLDDRVAGMRAEAVAIGLEA